MKKIPARCLLDHICSMTKVRQTLEDGVSGIVELWSGGILVAHIFLELKLTVELKLAFKIKVPCGLPSPHGTGERDMRRNWIIYIKILEIPQIHCYH